VHEILLPRLTETMEEGMIVAWLVDDGATVRRGEPLVEVETDKASTAFEAEADGVLRIIVPAGETVAVGTAIARLQQRGEPDQSANNPDSNDAGRDGNGSRAQTDCQPVAIKATPVARRTARDHDLDLRDVQGTGPGGRIRREDVERAVAARDAAGAVASAAAVSTVSAARSVGKAPVGTSAKGVTTFETLSRVQATIARRMAAAKSTIPDFPLTIDAEVESVLQLRDSLRHEGSGAPSVNDFVVKAVAVALREHPRVNGCFQDGAFARHSRINVGIAVAVDDGLFVPTIFDADEKSLTQISREARALATRVREGTITPAELAGGTFTVSNLGMFGVRRFTPIVNPGQAAILGVGAAQARCLPGSDGVPLWRRFCELTLVSDHRILYGADAARFVARVSELLARPLSLLGSLASQ
jgi:pyruvate dehydrogenase E2 component (dihydrolipoamide acetyltransferase)